MDFLTKHLTVLSNTVKTHHMGIAGHYFMTNEFKPEPFNSAGGDTAVLIIMAIIMIVLWILMIIASYKIMGGSDGAGVLHAVGTLFLGTFWVSVVWIWAGLSGRKICKLHK